MNDKLAPVVMVGYSRAWTLRKSLKNLSECHGLGDRDIYFFQDAPYRDEDIPKVEAMHQVAVEAKNTILPHLIIVRRERNLGVPGNLLAAVRETMDRYGRIIFFEDDVLVSRTFVRHMDRCLEAFKDDHRIFCINGYVWGGVKVPGHYKKDLYLNPRNSAWGWATWKDRWDAVDFSMKDWPLLSQNKEFMDNLHAAGADMLKMAREVYAGKTRTWDLQCSVHMVRRGLYAVAPRYNLTRNIGFGVEGVNCHGNGKSRKKYYNFDAKIDTEIYPCPSILRQLTYIGGSDRLLDRVKAKLLMPYHKLHNALLVNAFEEPQEVSA